MASSFFGGFASSLANSLGQRAQQEQAQKDWEWKAKKAAELEEQMASTRKVSSKVFEQNGQHFVQSFNAAGEPVGQPIPASPARIEEYNQGIENRELELAKQRAAKAADEARAANLEAETGTIKDRESRADRESAARIARDRAAEGLTNAQAYDAYQSGSYQEMVNKAAKNNPTLIGSFRKGGSQTIDPQDKQADLEEAEKLIKSMTGDDVETQNAIRETVLDMIQTKDMTKGELNQLILQEYNRLRKVAGGASGPIIQGFGKQDLLNARSK